MSKSSIFLLAVAAALAGCAAQPAGDTPVSDRPAAASVDVGIDWGWRIVGDVAVRPVQVFSLHGMTYLQMKPGAREVVLMADGVLANHRVYPPYLVIAGTPRQIDVVADGYRAIVTRMESAAPSPELRVERKPADTRTSSRIIRTQ